MYGTSSDETGSNSDDDARVFEDDGDLTMDVMTEEETQLTRIEKLCGETPASVTSRLPDDSLGLFTPQGRLKTPLPSYGDKHGSLEERIGRCQFALDRNIGDASRSVRRCLHVDPLERPSAAELLQDEWFRS